MARFLWTQKQDVGPAARFGHALSYSERRRTVLFGGVGAAGQSFDDTWEWDGEFWTQMADIGPAARSSHGMCFDANRRKTFLFGGIGGAELADSWSFGPPRARA